MTSRAWQKLMHALHGNGPTTALAHNPPLVKFMLPEINPLKTSVVNVTDLALDSGSFYHIVPSNKMLLNHRHSDQGFITADGCLSNATCKGTNPC